MSIRTDGNAVAIQGLPVASTAPTNGYVLAYNSGTGLIGWVAQTGGGGTVPTGTGFRHVTAGAEDVAARAVNLATADVTGVLPIANQAAQTLAGSLGGTTAAATVVAIDGSAGNCVVGASLTFSATASPQISQSPRTSDVAAQDTVISAQAPWSSAVTNKNSGNLLFGTLPPVAGGTAGTIQFAPGGGTAFQMVADTAQGANGALVVAPASGGATASVGLVRLPYVAAVQYLIQRRNAANTADLSILRTNGTTALVLGDPGAAALTIQSGAGDINLQTAVGALANPSFQLAYSSGLATITTTQVQISNASLSGTGILIDPTWNGAARFRFTNTVTSATIRVDDITTASATGLALTVQAQNATGTTTTGGDLTLAAGTGTTSNGKINFNNAITGTTVGAAGAGAALPATPTGYWTLKINGTAQRIPYYA